MKETCNHDPQDERESVSCEINFAKLMLEKELTFIATIAKITALTELLSQYEPGNSDRFWEVCSGLSEILSDIVAECHSYKEAVDMFLTEDIPEPHGKKREKHK
jgi:hypothetical protein